MVDIALYFLRGRYLAEAIDLNRVRFTASVVDSQGG